MFVSYAREIWTKSYVQTTRIFELLKKRGFFYSHFWQRVDAIFEDVSVVEISSF